MSGKLKNIDIKLVIENSENPRIIFRQEEMDTLLASIQRFGLQVPISVYEDKGKFVLIDGERRWKTCRKLNFKEIPALVQSKPSRLDNLLMMYNIHSLREQWDAFTIANKISEVKKLLEEQLGRPPKEFELSEQTGLRPAQIRRCQLLINLPDHLKKMLLDELRKPKGKQQFTEDVFLEIESCLKTVRNHVPDAIGDIDMDRKVLLKKYIDEVIPNHTDFRKISKIATATKKFSYDKEKAARALKRIFSDNTISIDQAYNETVSHFYQERRLFLNFSSMLESLSTLDDEERKDVGLRQKLVEIKQAIEEILSQEE